MRAEIILASASPRRAELLTQIGLRFEQQSADVDETPKANESAIEYVSRLARDKAAAVSRELEHPSELVVLGSDTAVVADAQILGKPKNRQHCLDMLERLSDRHHQVYTAVAAIRGGQTRCVTSISRVTFRRISAAEMQAYWDTGEPADKAGSYAIQGLAAIFVREIQGSYSGVMGLPLFETAQLLEEFGLSVLPV